MRYLFSLSSLSFDAHIDCRFIRWKLRQPRIGCLLTFKVSTAVSVIVCGFYYSVHSSVRVAINWFCSSVAYLAVCIAVAKCLV